MSGSKRISSASVRAPAPASPPPAPAPSAPTATICARYWRAAAHSGGATEPPKSPACQPRPHRRRSARARANHGEAGMPELSRRDMMLAGAAIALLGRSGTLLAFGGQAAGAAPATAASDRPAWDLTDLYPTDAAWAAERSRLAASIPSLAALRGTLGRDAASLRTALQALSDFNRAAARLSVYASLKADADLRDAPNQERRQQARDLFTAFN